MFVGSFSKDPYFPSAIMRFSESTSTIVGPAVLGFALGLFYQRWRGRFGRRSAGRGPQEALQRHEVPYCDLVDNSPDVIVILDADSIVRFVSPSVHQMLGYRPEEVTGTDISQYLQRKEPEQSASSLLEKFRPWRATSTFVELYEARHADGSQRYLEATVAELPDEAGAERAYYLRDITECKALEYELAYRAFQDPLTGLGNRTLFMHRLEHALSRLARQQESIAVLFIDLNNFKSVNDSLGHALGDQVLVTTGQRVQGCLRPADTAARFGGDEFIVLLENIRDVEGAANIANRILKTLKEPIILGSRKLSVTASVGVAMSSSGAVRAQELLRAADIAMYQAKARGESSYAVYEANGHTETGAHKNQR